MNNVGDQAHGHGHRTDDVRRTVGDQSDEQVVKIGDRFGHQVTKHDHLVDFDLGHRLLMVRYQFGNQFNDFGHRFGQEQLLQASLKSAEMFLILAGRGARSLM